ncbi:TetR/AcrR family transcriptional regulator [Streptomyces iranensis]|uniref:AcrR family transcriptional regulator n=1 Tax=Streptomyces iranensis TaxID=576784 RepID=A0A061A1C3_9ACTN|nr:TetR/AcrR family transcriptional regulator [Streptomyces iranensis]MBP2067311.1 AcrR family transcriptional regulator [Streptomyces iranensis]CDR15125.1 transcriptional regulator, TetR family protein [Streptomyces iranensis]
MPEPDSLSRPSGAQIRDRLIEAAAEEFAERGYDRARVQDIARRAGLSTGAIYGNFRNKAELLAEAVDYGLASTSHRLGQALDRGASPAEVLRLITTDSSGTRLRMWAPLVSEALAAARRDAEVARRVHTALGRVESRLTDLVTLAQRDGSFSSELDAAACARLMLCVSIGMDVLTALSVEGPDHDGWLTLMHHLFAGLTNR